MQNLGTVDGDPCSEGLGINARDQVVGGSWDCGSEFQHSFLWENGSIVDLLSLVSPGSGMQFRVADSINDRGEIAIQGILANGDLHAVLLIPCDDDHPNLEGCDYSMVDAAAVNVVSPVPATKVASPFILSNPAFGGPANPMLGRFGRQFGPSNRRLAGVSKNSSGSSDTAESAAASYGSSNDPAGSSCNRSTDLLGEDHLDGFAPRSDAAAGFPYCYRANYYCSGQVTGCRVVGPCGYHNVHRLQICSDLTYKRCCWMCR